MKTYLPLICFFFLVSAFGQEGSTLSFNINGGTIVAEESQSGLELPLTLEFSKDFKGKTVEILNEEETRSIALGGVKFGDDELSEEFGTEKYAFVIDKNGFINGEETKLADDKFVLKLADRSFKLSLAGANSGEGGSDNLEDYKAGYVYYDVMTLIDKSIAGPEKQRILLTYSDTSSIRKNPFLNTFYDGLVKTEAQGSGTDKLMQSVGNTDVTSFAQGLARFLAERAKQELNEAFFKRMKQQLNTYPELVTVFPKTASFLNRIETFAYTSVLNVLKESFEMDIKNLPENLYRIKNLSAGDCDMLKICLAEDTCKAYNRCAVRLDSLSAFFNRKEGHWVSLGLLTLKESQRSTNPANLIDAVVTSTDFNELKAAVKSDSSNYNILSYMELTNLFSNSFLSKDDERVWITSSQMELLVTQKDALKIYFGLLMAKEQSSEDKIIFYRSQKEQVQFLTLLHKMGTNYGEYERQGKDLIRDVFTSYTAADNAIKAIRVAAENSVEVGPDALYAYYGTLTSSLRSVVENDLFSKLAGGEGLDASYQKIENILTPAVDATYHISSKKYSAAIFDVSVLLGTLNEFEPEWDEEINALEKELKEKENDQKTVDELKQSIKQVKLNRKGFEKESFANVTKSFMKYGTLMAAVANAESSDEVKQAIESSVLPAGSYSIKHKSEYTLALSAYVGGYWSFDNTATSEENSYLPEFGLAAPVGISFSRGFGRPGTKSGGALTLNVQLIDVGALVSYYLVEGDTATIANDFSVRLSNIFSPGFGVYYSIPKTPLVLGAGGQYIPTLYTFDQINEQNVPSPTNAWRWQVSVLIDIPLLNLKVWDFDSGR